MNNDEMEKLYTKYPFAYFRQTFIQIPAGREYWVTIPDEDTDFFRACQYRLYPVLDPSSSDPTQEMIDKGAVFLGERAVYGRELKMPEGIDHFRGWRHYANRSNDGWSYADKLSGKFSMNPMIYCIDPSDPNAEEIIELNAMKRKWAKPCPFCGSQPNIFDPDFCYPVGRTELYQAGCIESAGGCTASVLGRGYYEAMDEWNTRVVW